MHAVQYYAFTFLHRPSIVSPLPGIFVVFHGLGLKGSQVSLINFERLIFLFKIWYTNGNFCLFFICCSEYLCHVYVRSDNLGAVLVADAEYPSRVAFTLLTKVQVDGVKAPVLLSGFCLYLVTPWPGWFGSTSSLAELASIIHDELRCDIVVSTCLFVTWEKFVILVAGTFPKTWLTQFRQQN